MKKLIVLINILLLAPATMALAEDSVFSNAEAYRKEFKIKKKVEFLLEKQMEEAPKRQEIRRAPTIEEEIASLGTPNRFCEEEDGRGNCLSYSIYWESQTPGRIFVLNEATNRIVVYQETIQRTN